MRDQNLVDFGIINNYIQLVAQPSPGIAAGTKRFAMKKLFVSAVLLMGMATASAQTEPWTAEELSGDIVYFLMRPANRIERFQLSSRSWLEPVSLDSTISDFEVDNGSLFILSGPAISEHSPDGTRIRDIATISGNPHTLLAEEQIFIVVGEEEIHTVNRSDGRLIDTDATPMRRYLSTGISHDRRNNYVIGRSEGFSPGDIAALRYTDDGSIVDINQSPYHGDFPGASMTWTFPDRRIAIDDSGTVYATPGLSYHSNTVSRIQWISQVSADEYQYVAITPDGTVQLLDSRFIDTGSLQTDFPSRPLSIYPLNESEFVLFREDSGTINRIGFEIVEAGQFSRPGPGDPINPLQTGVTIDSMIHDGRDTLLILDSEKHSVFRWDLVRHDWGTTIPLTGPAIAIGYSRSTSTLFTLYPNGRVSSMALEPGTDDIEELPFVNVPGIPNGILVTETTVVVGSGPDDFSTNGILLSYNLTGRRIDLREFSFQLSNAVWSQSLRKIFHFSEFSFPKRLFSLGMTNGGRFVDLTNASFNDPDVYIEPVRVSPDGSIVVVGSGVVFDGGTLQGLNRPFSKPVVDACWLGQRMFVLSGESLTEVLEPGMIPGTSIAMNEGETPIRVIPVSENLMALVTVDADERPHFYIYDPDLTIHGPLEPQPRKLEVINFTTSAVEIRWNPQPGISCRVERLAGDGSWEILATVDYPQEVYLDDQGVAPGSDFKYRVIAISSTGSASEPSPVATVELLLPDRVTGFNAEVLNENSVILTWPDSGLTLNHIIESRVDGGEWEVLATVSSGVSEFTDSTRERGTVVDYRITAVNGIGQSQPSDPVQVRMPVLPPVFNSLIQVTIIWSISAQFQWPHGTNVDTYRIERSPHSPDGSREFRVIGEVSPVDGEEFGVFIDMDRPDDIPVVYQVVAVNEGGESRSVESEVVMAIPLTEAPYAPILQGGVDGNLNASLSWDYIFDTRQYTVLRKQEGQAEWEQVAELPPAVTEFIDTSATRGLTYSYSLISRNEAGSSAPSNTVTFNISQKVVLLSEDFDNPDPDSKSFDSNYHVIRPGGSTQLSQSFAYFHLPGRPRSIETVPLQFLNGGEITFRLKAGDRRNTDGSWDPHEPGDGINIEYSLDQISWRTIQYIDTTAPNFQNWESVRVEVPSAIYNKQAGIRISQPLHSQSGDFWGIDNVEIITWQYLVPEPVEFGVFTSMTHDRVALLWIRSPIAEYHKLEKSLDGGATWQELAIVYNENFLVDDQSVNEALRYRISAGNPAGLSTTVELRPSVTGSLPQPGPSHLDEWRLKHFGTTLNEGTAANDYQNVPGYSNLTLFAIGLSPNGPLHRFNEQDPVAGGTPLVRFNQSTGAVELIYTGVRASAMPELVYAIQTAPSITGPWKDSGLAATGDPLDEIREVVIWSHPMDDSAGSGQSTLFIRLLVDLIR